MAKRFDWSSEKNAKLLAERGVTFETIISHIESGGLLEIVPGKGKYKHQEQFIVLVNNYVHVVPYVEDAEKVFLKTIIPSSELTRQYFSGGDNEKNR